MSAPSPTPVIQPNAAYAYADYEMRQIKRFIEQFVGYNKRIRVLAIGCHNIPGSNHHKYIINMFDVVLYDVACQSFVFGHVLIVGPLSKRTC